MPATSKAQQELMAIAEHHPEEVSDKNKGVTAMSHTQLHEFASTPHKGLPEHVKQAQGKLGGRDAAAHQHAHTDTY